MIKYYLVMKKVLYKGEVPEEKSFLVSRAWIYRNGSWIEVAHTEINDRLMGYDSSEPAGSPYGFMNDDIMDEIEEISEDEAEKYMKF